MAGSFEKKPALTFSWRGLTVQLFLVVILPLTALLLFITLGSLALHQQAMRMLVGERDELAVRTAALAIEEQIQQRANIVQLLAQQADGLTSPALADLLSRTQSLSQDFEYGLAFWNANGILESSSGDTALWQGLEVQIDELITQTTCGCGSPIAISSTFLHPQTGERIVLILASSPDNQRVAAGSFSAAGPLHHSLGEIFSGQQLASFLVIDQERDILYQTGQVLPDGTRPDHPGITEALQGKSGTTYVKVGRDEHVVAYSSVGLVNWGLISEEPWETVTSPTLRMTQLAPLALVPALLLALLGLWFGARQVVQPLQRLEAQAARLSWGDFQAIAEPAGGIAEIQRLQAELAHMAQKVQAAQRSLHDYIGVITAAQEEERRRLARELHDDTIQSLVALKQRAQLAQLELGDNPASDALAELSTLTEQSIENLRRLTRALRPIYLEDLGLTTALEMLASETGPGTDLSVSYACQGVERRLEPETELTLYRMAQEALNNVVRHAQASHAEVNIQYTPEEVILQVSDNGRGFVVPKSPAEFSPSGHFGLLGLNERAELIGAKLTIESTVGKGTCLTVSLPLPPSTESLPS